MTKEVTVSYREKCKDYTYGMAFAASMFAISCFVLIDKPILLQGYADIQTLLRGFAYIHTTAMFILVLIANYKPVAFYELTEDETEQP